MNVKKITARIAENNIASIQTAMNLGFYKTADTYYKEFHGKKYLYFIYQHDL